MAGRQPLPPEFGRRPFATGAARAAGIGEGRLRGRDLDRPFHGVRVPSTAPDALPHEFGDLPGARAAAQFAQLVAHCRAYAPLLRPGQFFSHETAARLYKAPMPDPFRADEPLHVSVRASGRAPRSDGISGHQAPASARIVDRFGLPVAEPAAAWLALAPLVGTRITADDLVAVADHLVLDPRRLDPRDPRPYIRIADLRAAAEAYRGRGARAASSAASQVREGVESRPETRLRLVLVRAGLPEPEVGVDIFDDAGRWLGRADQLFRQWKVISEYDGEQHRTSDAQYARDETRIEEFNRAGFATVRVRKNDLFGRPQVAVDRVARALRAAGWPG